MSGEKLIHISIYLKNDNSKGDDDKYISVYNVDDDDANLLFSPEIFPEPFIDWCKDLGSSPDLIRTRLQTYVSTHSVEPHIVAKINAIADFIDRNLDKYVGIVTVF